jgi:hypothetical protein
LYSEQLGKEVGFYKDPYNNYGRLEDQQLRAIRLVVDTGVHYKHWTRDQVVQVFPRPLVLRHGVTRSRLHSTQITATIPILHGNVQVH